jgi:hypothetical protein
MPQSPPLSLSLIPDNAKHADLHPKKRRLRHPRPFSSLIAQILSESRNLARPFLRKSVMLSD